MKQFRHHIALIIKSPYAIMGGIIAAGGLSRLMRSFTNLDLIYGNKGTIGMYGEITFNILFTILFGIFIAATIYKRRYMRQYSAKDSAVGLIGSFFGTLVAGCPSCTITFASYIGLASIVSILPRGGLELKIIGLGLMIRSIYDTVTKLYQCNIKPKTQKN